MIVVPITQFILIHLFEVPKGGVIQRLDDLGTMGWKATHLYSICLYVLHKVQVEQMTFVGVKEEEDLLTITKKFSLFEKLDKVFSTLCK